MKETAPMTDAVSKEQGGEPSSMILDNPHRVEFNEVELPLGRHFEHFWQDFVNGDLPDEVVHRLDERAKKFRTAYAQTQSEGISLSLNDLRITLLISFNDRPEEWNVEL
jgi:hypothetical protein